MWRLDWKAPAKMGAAAAACTTRDAIGVFQFEKVRPALAISAQKFELVVAEGVETEAQWHLLQLLDCDEMQAFCFGRPVSSEGFEATYLVPSRK